MVEPREPPRDGEARLSAAFVDAKTVLAKLADRLCASSADAHDLVQDTFERATRQGIPDGVRSPRAWLTTIMHNLFIDQCRASARKPASEPLDEDHGDPVELPVLEPPWARASVEDVRAAVSELEPTFREVYVLHTFEQHSYAEIAAKLSIQRITVGTRLNRARQKLRAVLTARLGLEVEP